MALRRSKSLKPWRLFPELHKGVCTLLETENLYFAFHSEDDDNGYLKSFDTNVMGFFNCYNKRCNSNRWASKMIATTIRLYPNNEYNARVYNQRCRACGQLGKPTVNHSYAERVVYRLKKWSGREVEPPIFNRKETKPHESTLCEGCKAGRCKGTGG